MTREYTWANGSGSGVCRTECLHVVQSQDGKTVDYKCDDKRCISRGCQFCDETCFTKNKKNLEGKYTPR